MPTKYEELVRAESEPEPEPDPSEPEPGEPDPSEPAPSEPEPEPQTAMQGVDEKALEREIARYQRAMGKILGGAFPDLAVCGVCDGMGFTPHKVDKPAELVQHPDLKTCDLCAGQGLVLTGSKRAPNTEQSCPRCNGNGYIATGVTVEPAQPVQTPTFTLSNGTQTSGAAPVDQSAIEALRRAGYVVEPIAGTPPQ